MDPSPGLLAGGELEGLVALMPDVAIVVDESGAIVSANARIEEVFGYKPSDLVGERVELLIPERLRFVHRQHREAYGEAPKPRQMGLGLDLYGRRRDGSEFPVDVSLGPVHTDAGLRVVAAIRDVSDRKSSEAASAQLAAIVRSSMDAIVSMTVQGSITSWNPGAETLFGYGEDEVAGRHVSILVSPGRSEELEMLLSAAMEGAISAPLDTRWLRRDGSEVDVAISVSPVRARDGQLIGLSVLVRDVTERKEAEEELRRLLSEVQRRERWQSAMADMRLAMLSETGSEHVLQLLCDTARHVLSAESALVAVKPTDKVIVVSSSGAPEAAPPDNALVHEVLGTGELRTEQGRATDDGEIERSPAICAPFNAGAIRGALLVVRALGGPAPDAIDLRTTEAFAEQAGLALQLNRARDDQERLMLVADRERIARDLHDLVIQRLFAVGMALQAAARLLRDEQAAGRVNAAVDDLDETIREIRTVIFELEPPPAAVGGLRSEVLELAARARDGLGFDPVVRFEGPVDSGVSPDVVPHLLAAAQEALSNVARHARASRAELEVAVGEDVRLTVSDDGRGIGDLRRSSGLANLRERAESLGGDLEVGERPGGGTRLVWRVPRSN